MNIHNLRIVKINDIIYIRAEDISEYILNLGSAEETDVRNRLKAAADNIKHIGKPT